MGLFTFARPARLERTVVRGPNPVTVFEAAAVDVLWARGMQGHAGTIRAGEPSSPSMRYSGDLGPQQSFRGGVPLAAHLADRRGFNTALPNTHGPVATPNTVLDVLGQVPPAGSMGMPS